MKSMNTLNTAAALASLAAIANGQYTTVALESFDYTAGTNLDMQNLGAGWGNFWVSPFSVNAVVVTTPGFDAIGEKATTNVNNEGSYRVVATGGFEAILAPNGQFGGDDSTLWVSFGCVRIGDDRYGGLSLFEFVAPGPGEKLFLGSPYQTNEWGIEDYPGAGGGGPQSIPGTSADVQARIVTRIDFQAGGERVRMWIDPVVPHPATAADLDTTVLDFTFNEVRLQSGEMLTTVGYHFDDILIEAEGVGPVGTSYCLATANSTGVPAAISGSGSSSITANDLVLVIADVPTSPGIGIPIAGPTQAQLPFFNGFLCIAPVGLTRINQIVAPDVNGTVIQPIDYTGASTGTVPLNVVAGQTFRYQYWFRDPSAGGGNANFSDGLAVVHIP